MSCEDVDVDGCPSERRRGTAAARLTLEILRTPALPRAELLAGLAEIYGTSVLNPARWGPRPLVLELDREHTAAVLQIVFDQIRTDAGSL